MGLKFQTVKKYFKTKLNTRTDTLQNYLNKRSLKVFTVKVTTLGQVLLTYPHNSDFCLTIHKQILDSYTEVTNGQKYTYPQDL